MFIYTILYILIAISFVTFLGKVNVGKKQVYLLHLSSFGLLIINEILNSMTSYSLTITFKELIGLIFLITGALSYSLYFKSQKTYQNFYFGLYFFPPALVGLSYMTDKILYLILSGPLLLFFPNYESFPLQNSMEIRSYHSVTSIGHSILVNKQLLFEKEIGVYNDEIYSTVFSDMSLFEINSDSYVIEGKEKESGNTKYLTFIKSIK